MPPIVLLHGWGVKPSVWEPLLTASNFADEILAPHLIADAGSLEDWAERQLAITPQDATVIAWSLGAMLAMTMASIAPQRFSRLILFAATPSFVQRDNWPHALDLATITAFRENFLKDAARTTDRFIALQALGDAQRSSVATTLRSHTDDSPENQSALAHGLRLLEQSDLLASLPSTTLRCLLIHGERDALMPSAATHWLSQRWPASETFVMPEVGHAPFISQPATVAARIQTFLNAHPS